MSVGAPVRTVRAWTGVRARRRCQALGSHSVSGMTSRRAEARVTPEVPDGSGRDGPGIADGPDWLRPGLVHDVDQRLAGPAEAGQARLGDHVADPDLAGLCAERQPDVLRQR